ncbi:hypothetical protein GH714_012387 [Hevea brasiliensis]|uniref:SHSP domain-containing protein n=1 Tax=Hevea brasiliensis TaxID=3981 RepID=A0A6A6MYW2_HEVBR|nr:hypothetical protein GH714_012387 [Hevea brasiliensis]
MNDKWHRVERSTAKFLRRFRLPENAKMDQINANMEDGVLKVVVPQEQAKKSEVKPIEMVRTAVSFPGARIKLCTSRWRLYDRENFTIF